MKYQIQSFNATDHTGRKVVASVEGSFSQEALTDWYNSEIEGKELEDGFQFGVVTADHPWFVVEESKTSQPLPGTNENLVDRGKASKVKQTFAKPEQAIAAGNKRALQDRETQLELQAELEKAKRKVMGG